MAINFPTSLDSLTNPTSTDLMENAVAALDHDVQHSNANDAIEALEAKVGINSSAVTTSHDYKLSGVTGSDKAVSKTGTETLTNKTLTSPQINFGSDANGDLIYRNGSGVTTRLAIGTTDQILAVQSGLPAWIANPSATTASTTTAGIVELATTAETLTGTDDTRAVTPKGIKDAGYIITPTDIQTFTANGTWTKPAGAKMVEVFCIGGGGGGGGADHTLTSTGASGGGGGARVSQFFAASDLGSTVSVTVGAGGTGGTAGAGTAGGNTSFGSMLIAYGGGYGSRDNTGSGVSGGGGGGSASAGGNASVGSSTTGGSPTVSGTAAANGISTGGAGCATVANGKPAEYGGGAGAGMGGDNVGFAGGDSIWGGGGGGAGASGNTSEKVGGNGGGLGFSTGSGGAGGVAASAGTAGAASSLLTRGGQGGGGGGASRTATAGGAGGAGGIPGGGGGGGGMGTTTDGIGGAGARGQCVVITYF